MKHLSLRLFAFLFIVIFLDQLFGVVMSSVLKNTEKGDWGRNNFIFNKVNSDILILGSSRAIHHFNPQIFSDTLGMSCYNCGEDGMGIFLMYARFVAITERYKPKLIIYEILPGFDMFKERDNLKYMKFLRPYINNPLVESISNNISSVEQYKLLSNAYRYNSVFLDILAQRISRASETAKDYTYMPLYKEMRYHTKREVDSKVQSKVLLDTLKMTYIEQMMISCKKSGIKMVCTVSPIYSSFSDNQILPLQALCDKYDVPIINYSNERTFCDHGLFADESHLNVKGAELFSAILASQIKDYL